MSTGIKLKAVPNYPAQVVGGAGIDVAKTNGNYTVELDYSQFAIVSPYTKRSTDYVLVFDSVMGSYFLVPATSF
jgi:hypothetical protein